MTELLNETDIDQLNKFLRGEMSAVETYEQALEKADDPRALMILEENKKSHVARVELLVKEVRRLGGEPADSSGAWGAFARAVEGGAKLFGESAAVAALEEGEDHGLSDYREDHDDLSLGARQLVRGTLVPEQQRTHDALARLKEILD